jgi:SHS2 domain-containing protein
MSEIAHETTGENATLHDFDVTITETMQKTVNVKAVNQADAEQMVGKDWKNEKYVLDTENFAGVEFEAKPTGNDLTIDEKPLMEGGDHDMSNSDTTPNATTIPLYNNPYVQDLFKTLSDNGKDTSGLSAILNYTGEMENLIKRAEGTISDMKSQLEEVKQLHNHPVKTALQNAIKALERKVIGLRENLMKLKNNIVNGCKNAVSAFKAQGIIALDNVASFINIKDSLQDWKKDAESGIRTSEKAIANIETFASEYHTAGLALKNMARMAVGKPPVDTKKEMGNLAKAVAAPYKAQKAVFAAMKNATEKAITNLDKFENKAVSKRSERAAANKPSIMKMLHDNIDTVAQMKRDTPIKERVNTKGAEL